MNRRGPNDQGAVVVIVAIFLVVLCTVAAFAVDVGYWATVRRQLQSAADAAALAGCQELSHGASDSEVWSVVTDYAGRNFSSPVQHDRAFVVEPTPGGLSDIGPDYVKVTVREPASTFFSRIMHQESQLMQAQSIAKIGYLAGAENPVPWGLPILHAERVSVQVAGGVEDPLSKGADGVWRGSIGGAGVSGPLDVIAYNSQTLDPAYPGGVPERMEDVARLSTLPTGSRFLGIETSRRAGAATIDYSHVFTSGSGESVVVYASLATTLAAGETVVVKFDNRDYAMTAVSPTLFRGTFPAPGIDDLVRSFAYAVEIRRGGRTVAAVTNADYFCVRRSTYPILDVRVGPTVFPAGTTPAATVEVVFNDYVYGRAYEMKVVGGMGEIGNYMALDFSGLHHYPYWRQQDPVEYPDMPTAASGYYDYLAANPPYTFLMHVGDTVWTQTGNMSFPQTRSSLLERFAGEVSDFAGWEAAGRPDSRRVVIVPIVEKVQEVTGQTPLRVVSFGSFYIENVFGDEGNPVVVGRFVEYTQPSWVVVDDPPDPLATQAVHLVSDGLDF